jgi:maltose alpha-D-glucosyltransferase/alpha-amylase
MPEWLKNSVFYEIYPQSFYDTNGDGIGDLNGIIEKLDYISQLGCNAIWINPCFDSPFMDAGYDVRDYKRVAPRYGTNEDLYRLFKAAHQKGLKVLLDLVPGHTSEDHEWFKKSLLPEKNEYTNRYIWTDSAWTAPMTFRCIGGRSNRDGNYIVNFFSTQPALNYGFNKVTESWQLPYTNPDCVATKEMLKDVMRFWLKGGCDGFRVDMAYSLVKNDDDKTATSEIWLEIRHMLDNEFPDSALIAEWSDPLCSLKCGFDSDFLLNQTGSGYQSLFRNIGDKAGEQLSFFSKFGKGDIKKFTDDYLKRYNGSKDYGYISLITCNHDTPRMSRNFDETELKLAYAFIFTMPGVPFLYYGDEIGMSYIEGLISKEGGYSRTGTRTPMQWNNNKNFGFSTAESDKLYLPVDKSNDAPTVENQSNRKDSLLQTVKDIIKLRKTNESLQADCEFGVLYAEREKYPFIYKRGEFIIGVNPSSSAVYAPVGIANGDIIYSIGEKASFDSDAILMAPQSFTVIKQVK